MFEVCVFGNSKTEDDLLDMLSAWSSYSLILLV